MYYRKLFTMTLVVQPILLISGVRTHKSIGGPIGFVISPSFMGKTQSYRCHYCKNLPEQIVSIADRIKNYEFIPLPPVTKHPSKNLYLPGETYNIDPITLKIYAHELSQLLCGATLIGVTQVSQERLHAIFLHFRDKWRGTSRLIIYHQNKFYPPIYLGSNVATLYTLTNISNTYLEDTLNVLKNLVVTQVSYKMSSVHTLEIDLVDKTVNNSMYRLKFAPGNRRNNLTVTDITSDTGYIELFNSDEWIFPEKKRQIDRGKMLKNRLNESRQLYNSMHSDNSLKNTIDTNSNKINDSSDNANDNSDINTTFNGIEVRNVPNDNDLEYNNLTNIFGSGKNKKGNIPIAKLMNQSVPGLSLGTAVDICRSANVPEEKFIKELTNIELQFLMDKVKMWQKISVDDNELLPHISQIDGIYYYNVTNFRGIDTSDVNIYTSVMEMLYCYYESNTIPCRHRDLANKAANLCETQKGKLERMANSITPTDSSERLAVIEDKIDLLDNYNKSISECMLYTTMDSHQMLLEMIEDMQELTSSKCTGTTDRIKFKGNALEFDKQLHKFTQNDNAFDKSNQNASLAARERLYGGLLAVKCLVDDPDSPVLVIGRNAKQNEKIIMEIGKPEDLWFHASHVPGAHVLLKYKKKLSNEMIKKVIQFSADVAAYFSKAKGGRKSYSLSNVKPCVGDSSVEVTMARFSDVVKEEGMEMGAVLIRAGKIIKANPRRARKKVEDAINHRINSS